MKLAIWLREHEVDLGIGFIFGATSFVMGIVPCMLLTGTLITAGLLMGPAIFLSTAILFSAAVAVGVLAGFINAHTDQIRNFFYSLFSCNHDCELSSSSTSYINQRIGKSSFERSVITSIDEVTPEQPSKLSPLDITPQLPPPAQDIDDDQAESINYSIALN